MTYRMAGDYRATYMAFPGPRRQPNGCAVLAPSDDEIRAGLPVFEASPFLVEGGALPGSDHPPALKLLGVFAD